MPCETMLIMVMNKQRKRVALLSECLAAEQAVYTPRRDLRDIKQQYDAPTAMVAASETNQT